MKTAKNKCKRGVFCRMPGLILITNGREKIQLYEQIVLGGSKELFIFHFH